MDQIKAKITATVKKNVPMKTLKSKGRPRWMSQEILAAIRRKKRLWKMVKGKEVTEEYREVDRRVKKMIRNAKRKMEKQLADGDGS